MSYSFSNCLHITWNKKRAWDMDITPHCRRTPIWLIFGNHAFVFPVCMVTSDCQSAEYLVFCRFSFVLVKWCVLIKCVCLCYMRFLSYRFMLMSLINIFLFFLFRPWKNTNLWADLPCPFFYFSCTWCNLEVVES